MVAPVFRREVKLVLLYVMNEAGRRFQVRCIHKGDRYGINGCLVHDQDEPVIEFTDATPDGGPVPTAELGFIARIPARTFLGGDGGDVWLFGRDVAWRLAPEQVRQVSAWLSRLLPDTRPAH